MTLDAESLTKAQRTAVKWLRRHDGRVHRPGITGETLTMTGRRWGRYHSSYVWRSTIRALITRGWLVMDGPDHWRLADGVGAALDAAESLEAAAWAARDAADVAADAAARAAWDAAYAAAYDARTAADTTWDAAYDAWTAAHDKERNK